MLDVTSDEDWLRVVRTAVTNYGKLDVLVNNAGIGGRTTVDETCIEAWDRVMDVNTKGVFLGTKAAIGGGSIINISSIRRRPSSTPVTGYGSTWCIRNSWTAR